MPHGGADIVREKLDQAAGILVEQGVDLWLTLVRETLLTTDPCLELIAGVSATWEAAFLLSRTGERIAVAGRYDTGQIEALGAYEPVIGYDESIRPLLREAIERADPLTLAVNTSLSDPAADGLTHGLWSMLHETLAGTPYGERLVSSERVVNALRGRKSPAEVARIRAAVRETEAILHQLTPALASGQTESEIAAGIHGEIARRGLGHAWEPALCPIVTAGPDSGVGHTAPGVLEVRPGRLLHVDVGVRRDGYCSDLQRVWYVLADGETVPPGDVLRAWGDVWAALDAGAAALRPGALGWEVDAAARAALVAAGWPEPLHALGHQLGRAAHDGGTTLAPRWDRYGRSPYGVVEEDNVFTLEYGVSVPGRGYVGIEEDVRVTGAGLEWLSEPQRELWLVG